MIALEVECEDGTSESLRFDNKEEFDFFNERLMDCLYNRRWCSKNGVDYVNPDMRKVHIKLYQELYPL